jgi:hypothetical protein
VDSSATEFLILLNTIEITTHKLEYHLFLSDNNFLKIFADLKKTSSIPKTKRTKITFYLVNELNT